MIRGHTSFYRASRISRSLQIAGLGQHVPTRNKECAESKEAGLEMEESPPGEEAGETVEMITKD